VWTRSTRGRKPEAAIAEAKTFAERGGYRGSDNLYPDLAFDFQIFKPQSIRFVKMRQTRHRIDPDALYNQLFPEENRGLRELPFPPFIPRKLWRRTRTSGPGAGCSSTISRLARSDGGDRTITRTPTPGDTCCGLA